ncbi:hypothetical protein ABZ946_33255 [Streptomyces sp. NPDC046324]|uniref:hypothetical protein n=1 Tax=Streptomyces sp. NPDC046324 TaxID=3154915 RepID=UPI0033E05335
MTWPYGLTCSTVRLLVTVMSVSSLVTYGTPHWSTTLWRFLPSRQEAPITSPSRTVAPKVWMVSGTAFVGSGVPSFMK